ncbi:MAG: hypothetical protein ACI9F9_002435 [Candidatus Paceibacteria bacterium]|jgi:hypothetical protein
MTMVECAVELDTSEGIVKDRSRFALAWLRMRMRMESGPDA